jgi:hypothetical protein
MATNKSTADAKSKLPTATPWVLLGLNVVAAVVSLIGYYKKEVDEAFVSPYTHMHYTDSEGKYICGDKYINKQHICDGRFLNVRAEIPTLDVFLSMGLTKEQWESAQKTIKQFKCGGNNETS